MARILLIAADPASAAPITDLLVRAGHQPLLPGSAAAHAAPDLVLCMLPAGADAGKLLAGLRGAAAPPGVPVLALMPRPDLADTTRLAADGYDGYIALPLEPASFVAEVEAFLPPQPAQAQTMLLVDDDAYVLELLGDLLAAQGYRVLRAGSGAAALEILAREPVQVVVSDQWMPGMSGTELMAQVKTQYPHTARLILSAQLESGDIARAVGAGIVDAFHSKPWSGASLHEGLRDAFLLARGRAAA